MKFVPNLLGKITFVLICCLEYLFVVCPIVRFLSTKWLSIDILIFLTVMFGCGYITVKCIWKFLKYLAK